MRSLVIVYSYHHHNTEKIAKVIAKVLDAQIKTPRQINPEELHAYDLVGFGSGIYSDKHHESLLVLADKLPRVTDGKAFIFSTNGAPALFLRYDGDHSFHERLMANHSSLREKLRGKGYLIVDEFFCPGFNTNSFLKLFGGVNKGRPNDEDLEQAEVFARKLKQSS